jgi:hypothetical protein
MLPLQRNQLAQIPADRGTFTLEIESIHADDTPFLPDRVVVVVGVVVVGGGVVGVSAVISVMTDIMIGIIVGIIVATGIMMGIMIVIMMPCPRASLAPSPLAPRNRDTRPDVAA